MSPELAAEKMSRELAAEDEKVGPAPPPPDHEERLRTLEGQVKALHELEPRVGELELQVKHLQLQVDQRALPPRQPE